MAIGQWGFFVGLAGLVWHACGSAALAAGQGEAGADAGRTGEVRKAGDQLVAREVDGRTVVAVTSGMGIGSGSVQLTAADWARPLVIELRYADGRGFGMLEHLSLTAGNRLRVLGAAKDDGRMAFYWGDGQGTFPDELNMSGWLRVRIEREPGVMRMVFPPRMLEGEARLALEWVDAYR